MFANDLLTRYFFMIYSMSGARTRGTSKLVHVENACFLCVLILLADSTCVILIIFT